MSGAPVARTLDCRGFVCPVPVIKLSKAIKTIDLGAVLEMLATDPGSAPDVEAFQKQTGHRVVDQSQSDGVIPFLIRRMK